MNAVTETEDRAAWLEQRRTGIGGSDVAAILGLSKWKTPLQVFMEKRGQLADIGDNEPMRWGRLLEPVILARYADVTGHAVLRPTGILRHPHNEFMIASLDGMTPNERVVEAKTARTAEGWGEPGTDEVPQDYLLQTQHYLAVTGFAVADIAVLIGGSDFRLYEVPADKELQGMMIEAEAEFWRRVLADDPPEPVSYADVVARFGRASKAVTVEAPAEIVEAAANLRSLRARMKTLEAEEEHFKAAIIGWKGGADTLVAGGVTLATWKAAQASERLDAAALRKAHPDICAQFTKVGEPSRRFLLR